MSLEKIENIKDLLGDSTSEFVARVIKESYFDLWNEKQLLQNNEKRCAIWSYDDKEELEQIERMMSAMKIAYEWYSCESIEA